MLAIGDTAPDFQLPDIHGSQKALRDYLAVKPALVALFKVSCPVCQFTLPFLERLAKSDNVEVIAISQDDAPSTEKFRAQYGVTLTTLLDEASRGYPVSNGFAIESVPSMFLVEPGGLIAMAVTGFSKRDLETVGKLAGVEPFLPGERVPDAKPG